MKMLILIRVDSPFASDQGIDFSVTVTVFDPVSKNSANFSTQYLYDGTKTGVQMKQEIRNQVQSMLPDFGFTDFTGAVVRMSLAYE